MPRLLYYSVVFLKGNIYIYIILFGLKEKKCKKKEKADMFVISRVKPFCKLFFNVFSYVVDSILKEIFTNTLLTWCIICGNALLIA